MKKLQDNPQLKLLRTLNYCENIVCKKVEPRIFLQKTPFFKITKYENFLKNPTNKNRFHSEQGNQAEQNKMSGDGILTSLCRFQ